MYILICTEKGGDKKRLFHLWKNGLDQGVHFKQPYIREDMLLSQLLNLIDHIDLSQVGVKKKLEAEIERLQKFSIGILGHSQQLVVPRVDAKTYAKYVLQEGGREEKRELLGCLKSKLYLKDEKLTLSEFITEKVG